MTWDEFGKVHGHIVIPKLISSFNQMNEDDQKEYLNLRSDKESSDKGMNLYNIYMVSTTWSPHFVPFSHGWRGRNVATKICQKFLYCDFTLTGHCHPSPI